MSRDALDHLLQHGQDWNGEDLAGWDISEKLNGVRAYWTGRDLLTRGGNRIQIPADWALALPREVPLDCELYDGINGLYRCIAAARYGRFLPTMRLVCFDAPMLPGMWRERMVQADQLLGIERGNVYTVPRWVARSTAHAIEAMRDIQSCGGEGLMARAPGLQYAPGRTGQLLKLKSLVGAELAA